MSLKHLTGMNKYHFNIWLFMAGTAVFFIFGCSPLDQKQVSGHYIRSCFGVNDSIFLNTNGLFEQIVIYTNGESWQINGSWKIINKVIQLDKCYLTFDDEKQKVIMPPLAVYSCTFSLDNRKLNRSALQPAWDKNN